MAFSHREQTLTSFVTLKPKLHPCQVVTKSIDLPKQTKLYHELIVGLIHQRENINRPQLHHEMTL